jgi:branched-chain amino acid transport system substrate-binding protein
VIRSFRVFVTVAGLAALAAALAGMALAGGSAGSQLGKPNKARGSIVPVTFISPGAAPAIGLDNTNAMKAAVAAVRYVNDYLGGISGHRVAIYPCATHVTPAGATDCANQAIQRRSVAGLLASDAFGIAILKLLSGAGIAYVASEVGAGEETTDPNSFVVTGGTRGYYGALAKYGQTKRWKRVLTVGIGYPSVVSGTKDASQALDKVGIAQDILIVPPGTPDMTPQIQSALSKRPDAAFIIGDQTFCVGAVKALDTAGYNGTVSGIAQCGGPEVVKASKNGLKGAVLFSTVDLSLGNPDVKLYRAVMKKYAPGVDVSGQAPAAFQSVLSFARQMAGIKGPITAATVKRELNKNKKAKAALLGAEATIQCGSNPVKGAPALCAPYGVAMVLGTNGTIASSTTYPIANLYSG